MTRIFRAWRCRVYLTLPSPIELLSGVGSSKELFRGCHIRRILQGFSSCLKSGSRCFCVTHHGWQSAVHGCCEHKSPLSSSNMQPSTSSHSLSRLFSPWEVILGFRVLGFNGFVPASCRRYQCLPSTCDHCRCRSLHQPATVMSSLPPNPQLQTRSFLKEEACPLQRQNRFRI